MKKNYPSKSNMALSNSITEKLMEEPKENVLPPPQMTYPAY